MDIRYSYATQLSNHSQKDIQYSLIKRPSNDIPDDIHGWIFDI